MHLLICECRSEPVPVLQGLTKEEYLEMATQWYDQEYPKAYEHYHKRGKNKALHLPPRETLLAGYFGKEDPNWVAYTKLSGLIRPYRNKVVHDVAMGTVLMGLIHLVPKKERIQNYGVIQSVQEAAKDIKRLKRDFVVREEQMLLDMHSIQTLLNALWERPASDLRRLVYENQNPYLLEKYNLEFVKP